MARLPYVTAVEASAEVQRTLAELPFDLNITRMMAHAETCLRPTLRLGQAILTSQELDPVVREMVILLVARTTSAEYAWVQHEALGRGLGITGEQLAALRDESLDAEVFDLRQRLALRFAAAVIREADVDDDAFAAVEKEFTPREVVELILAIGYYMTLARVMTVTRVDLEGAAGVSFDDLS